MANDIFGNQDIGQGQSAIQAAQPISNTSKATAIEGLQYLDPLIGKLAEGAAKQTETGNGDEVLNEFSRQLGALEASSKTTGGIKSKQELLNKQWQLAQRFKDYNPHLREDLDKIAKNSQDVYGFAQEDITTQAYLAAEKDDIKTAQQMWSMTEEDMKSPELVRARVNQMRGINAASRENEEITKRLSRQQQEITLQKGTNELSDYEIQREMMLIDAAKKKDLYIAEQNVRTIAAGGVSAVSQYLVEFTGKYKDAPIDLAARKEARWELERKKNEVTANLYQVPGFTTLPEATQRAMKEDVLRPINTTQEMLDGEVDLKLIQTQVSAEEKVALHGLYSGESGRQALQFQAVRSVIGDTAASSVWGNERSVQVLMGKGETTVNGNPSPDSFLTSPGDLAVTQARETTLSTLTPKARKANSQTGKNQEALDKDLFNVSDMVMNSIKPGPKGEIDNRQIQKVLTSLGDPELNAWAVRTKPDYSDAVKNQVGALIRQSHSEPSFKAAGNAINSTVTGTGKTVGDLVQIIWQDGSVVIKPKAGLSSFELESVNTAVKDFSKISQGLSTIIKAEATIQNTNDYQGVLNTYTDILYGVENLSNKKVEGPTDKIKKDLISTNAKNDLSYLTAQPEPAPTAAPSSTSTTSPAASSDDLDARAATIAESLRKDGLDDAAIQEMLKSFYESNGVKAVVIKK